MTTDMALSYVDAMPRVRAQRLLDAATASTARYQKAEWWEALESVAYARDDDREAPSYRQRSSPISINGMPMPIGQAKVMLAGALGSGFGEAA